MEGRPEEGKLVETGTFRVDAERMRRVLAKYQLPTPLHAVRELVRCAVLSGAPRLRLAADEGPQGRGFRAEFAGRPLSAAELNDIYAPLLAGADGRGRHLAAAVLALEGTGPSLLEISGGGASVALSGKASPPGAGAAGGEGEATVLRALWAAEPPGLDAESVLKFPAEAEAALVCCPLTVDSGRLSTGQGARRRAAKAMKFSCGGRTGFIEPRLEAGTEPLTGSPPAAGSEIGLHVAGVYAETLKLELPFAPVIADVGDDALRLDASFSACLRDANFAALMPFIEERTLELLEREAGRQSADYAAIGRKLKRSSPRALWRELLRGRDPWQGASGNALSSLGRIWRWLTVAENNPLESYLQDPPVEELTLMAGAARRAWWLQDACRRALKDRLEPPREGRLQCLWTAPVLFSGHGEPLSPASLRRRLADGKLAVSESYSGESDFESSRRDAVWLAAPRDREFLRSFVPESDWVE